MGIVPPSSQPTIVLVHGAFADASGWHQVIRLLEVAGYVSIGVQNPLTSLQDDVATTKRVLESISGPVVLVGHSYGGAVITGAAAGASNVKALVYIAALAPDSGEPVAATSEQFPAPPLNNALVPDSAGFLYIDPAKFHAVFAADLPEHETRVFAATQKPLHSSAFGASVPEAAWRTIPSWYLVCSEDKAINPDLERFFAGRINATTKEITSSHVPFLSHPQVVADLIVEAANG
jgi:pimeloyl-ACP methyl ester carboxylesterase